LAVTVDQASLGTQAQSGVTASTRATTAAVASGAMIVAFTFTFTTASPTASHTMSGGGLTWVRDHTATSGTLRISMHHAFAPSGLASGTDLTNTSANTSDHTWCMYSLAGVDTGTPVAAFNAAAASTAAWSSGALTGTGAGDAAVGGAGSDGSLLTTTPGGDAVERIDFNSATTSGSVNLNDDLNAEADDTVTGTWSGAQAHIGIAVSYNPAAGGGGVTVKKLAALGVG
jgi:hypothetical protein